MVNKNKVWTISSPDWSQLSTLATDSASFWGRSSSWWGCTSTAITAATHRYSVGLLLSSCPTYRHTLFYTPLLSSSSTNTAEWSASEETSVFSWAPWCTCKPWSNFSLFRSSCYLSPLSDLSSSPFHCISRSAQSSTAKDSFKWWIRSPLWYPGRCCTSGSLRFRSVCNWTSRTVSSQSNLTS